MTDKKQTQELNDAELDQVAGGMADTSGLSKVADASGLSKTKDGFSASGTGNRTSGDKGDGFITFGAETTT